MPSVNVRTAAELTGKDRSTITRAIDSGRLSAGKDEHGRYLIDPAELERVFGTLRSPDARTDAAHEEPTRTHDASALSREVELVREMLERERATHERERRSWDEERTFLRSLVEKQTEQLRLLPGQREQPQRGERPRPSLFAWFRRRPA